MERPKLTTNTQSKLVAILCGMPFSGTTLLSRVVTSHPVIEAGFECGLLFGESPQHFKEITPKFYNWMLSNEAPYNWKLSPAQLEDVCNTPTFEAAYNKIVRHCHLFKGQKQYIIDKTPAYVYRLNNIMQKVPNTPVIIIKKDLIFQYYSYKKRGVSLEEFIKRFERAENSKKQVLNKKKFQKRILQISFEELIDTTAKNYRKIINHIHKFNTKIEFSKDQISLLKTTLNTDINSNTKKLRKKYDYQVELEKAKQNLSKHELQILLNSNLN